MTIGGITKIALNFFLDFFGQSRKTRKIAKFWLSKSFFYVKNCLNLSKNIFHWKNINLGHQLLITPFFDKHNFENNLFLKLGRKIVVTKVGLLNWYSPMKNSFRKIQIIFDIEKWLWKSEFCNLAGLITLTKNV